MVATGRQRMAGKGPGLVSAPDRIVVILGRYHDSKLFAGAAGHVIDPSVYMTASSNGDPTEAGLGSGGPRNGYGNSLVKVLVLEPGSALANIVNSTTGMCAIKAGDPPANSLISEVRKTLSEHSDITMVLVDPAHSHFQDQTEGVSQQRIEELLAVLEGRKTVFVITDEKQSDLLHTPGYRVNFVERTGVRLELLKAAVAAYERSSRPQQETPPVPEDVEDHIRLRSNASHVILVGYDSRALSKLIGALDVFGLQLERVSSLTRLINSLSSTESNPRMVVIGTRPVKDGEYELDQTEVLKRVRKTAPDALVVVVIEDDDMSIVETLTANGADHVLGMPGGLDGFIAGGSRPADIARQLALMFHLYFNTDNNLGSEDSDNVIICEPEDRLLSMNSEDIDKVLRLWTEFDPSYYDFHQKRTGHYTIIDLVLAQLSKYIGYNIADMGCGSGHILRRAIRDILLPRIIHDIAVGQDPTTRILATDASRKMLDVVGGKFRRKIMDELPDEYKKYLHLSTLERNFLDIAPEDLEPIGGLVDTILLTYVIHWATDKERFVRMLEGLAIPGTRLITAEEYPVFIRPDAFITLEQAKEMQRRMTPIRKDRYFELLGDHGFRLLGETLMHIPIDPIGNQKDLRHRVTGAVFVYKPELATRTQSGIYTISHMPKG